jgi:hypothetical protein
MDDMTTGGLAKLEAKLAYNREWQRMKYQTDPEWRKALLASNKRYYQKKKAEAAAAPPDPNKKRPGRPRTRFPADHATVKDPKNILADHN